MGIRGERGIGEVEEGGGSRGGRVEVGRLGVGPFSFFGCHSYWTLCLAFLSRWSLGGLLKVSSWDWFWE